MSSLIAIVEKLDVFTLGYVLFMLLFGAGLALRFLWPLNRTRRRLRFMRRKGSWGDGVPDRNRTREITGESLLVHSWPGLRERVEAYLRDWNQRSVSVREDRAAPLDPIEYLPLTVFGTDAATNPLARATPFLFTGLGILGTFAGIVISLSQLQVSATNLEQAIHPLLDGMRTAFASSLVGVGMSLTWTVLAGAWQGGCEDDHRWILERIRHVYPLWDPLETVVSLAQEQDRRARELSLVPEQIEAALDRSWSVLGSTILEPAVLRLERRLDTLLNREQSVHEEHVRRMANAFIESLDRQTDGQLTRLAEVLGQLVDRQNQVVESTERILEGLGAASSRIDQFVSLSNSGAVRLEQSFDRLSAGQASLQALVGRLGDLEGSIGRQVTDGTAASRDLSLQTAQALDSMRLQIDALRESSREISKGLSAHVESLQIATGSIDRAVGSMGGRIENVLASTGDRVESAIQGFETGVAAGMDGTFTKIDQGLGRAVASFGSSLERAEMTLEQLPRLIHDLSLTLEDATRSARVPDHSRPGGTGGLKREAIA